MFRRIVVVATSVALVSSAPIHAQNAPSSGPKPATSTPQPPQSGSNSGANIELKNGYYYIGPKKPPPPKPKKPGTNGQLNPSNGVASDDPGGSFENSARSPLSPFAGGRNDSAVVTLARLDSRAPGALTQAPSRNTQVEVAEAEQHVLIPANTFVIQFRPGTPQAAQDELLRRYNLFIRRALPGMVFVVYRTSVPANEPRAQSLADVFNPPIIRSLRRERIIANATVDSPSMPRAIPKSSNTGATDERGFTHQWDWKLNTLSAGSASNLNAASQAAVLDGNWGLKAIRMPPVWTIIQSYRAANPNAFRPKLAIIDTGFSKHDDLAYNLRDSPNIDSPTPEQVATGVSSIGGPCNTAHGNHVAGIAGAIYGNGVGIDGIIPDSKIDAVPVLDQSMDPAAAAASSGDRSQQLTTSVMMRDALYTDVVTAVQRYVDIERSKSADLRVVNLSSGLNLWVLVSMGHDLDEVKSAIKATIVSRAQMSVAWLQIYEKSVLFVIAAGNDSGHLPTPLETKWSSSLAWLATGEIDPLYKRPKNILIVEASDRNNQRAMLSNIGGHISAPGIDILSTLSADTPYGVCDGTSMAAPHAAAVATLLFELAPTKTPAEIIDVMIKSAGPKRPGASGAPRFDALEAVMRLSPYSDGRNENLVRLTDLNGDGKVDIADLKEFARRLQILTDNRYSGTAFAEDLNGDKQIDANECNWPSIDFNGSGIASLSNTSDARKFLGEYRNDLAIMQMAWTDKSKDPATALKEAGLDAAVQAADKVGPPLSPQACR
jgi:Subtilase family